MARTLDQIMAELETAYAPQKQAVQQRIGELPNYYAAQQAGLDQTRANAFKDITSEANSRGVVYSGAPIEAQQKYVGSTYLPALAGLANQQNDQRYNLTQALGQLGTQQLGYAQDIRGKEMQLDEARRQFDQQMAAQREAEARAAAAAAKAAASQGFNFGGGGGSGGGAVGAGQPQQAAGGGTTAADVVRLARQSLGGGNQSWGAVANYIEKNLLKGKIATGSEIDNILKSIYGAPATQQPTGLGGVFNASAGFKSIMNPKIWGL